MTINSNEIQLIIFSSECDGHFQKILNAVPGFFPRDRIIQCRTISDFSFRLTDLLFGLSIVVVVARTDRELDEIHQMNGRLTDHSIILVLADEVDDTAQPAIRLYPRYTAYLKDDYTDVCLVLEKMITNIEKKMKGERHGACCQCN